MVNLSGERATLSTFTAIFLILGEHGPGSSPEDPGERSSSLRWNLTIDLQMTLKQKT